jgi:hypothetical protein
MPCASARTPWPRVLHGEGCPRRPGRVSPTRWDEPLGKPLPANGDAFKGGRGGRGASATVCAAQSSVQPSSRWMRPTAPRGKCSSSEVETNMARRIRRCDWWIWPLAYAHNRLTSSTRAFTLRRRDCRTGASPVREASVDRRRPVDGSDMGSIGAGCAGCSMDVEGTARPECGTYWLYPTRCALARLRA